METGDKEYAPSQGYVVPPAWLVKLEATFQGCRPLHAGFIGPSSHMRGVQVSNLRDVLEIVLPVYLHHGMSRGCDEVAHDIARGLEIATIGHPNSRRGRNFMNVDFSSGDFVSGHVEGQSHTGEFYGLREPRPFLKKERCLV